MKLLSYGGLKSESMHHAEIISCFTNELSKEKTPKQLLLKTASNTKLRDTTNT